jgi:rhodanese-related sulfurtransferase
MSGLMNLFAKKPESFITVDCGELEQIIESEGSNIELIDVRTEREHNRGHIPNSENVNVMSLDFVSKMEFLDKDKAYYVYCAAGNRSKTACRQMIQMGFTKVYNVRRGMMGWSGAVE